jgi:hypothetical protein
MMDNEYQEKKKEIYSLKYIPGSLRNFCNAGMYRY